MQTYLSCIINCVLPRNPSISPVTEVSVIPLDEFPIPCPSPIPLRHIPPELEEILQLEVPEPKPLPVVRKKKLKWYDVCKERKEVKEYEKRLEISDLPSLAIYNIVCNANGREAELLKIEGIRIQKTQLFKDDKMEISLKNNKEGWEKKLNFEVKTITIYGIFVKFFDERLKPQKFNGKWYFTQAKYRSNTVIIYYRQKSSSDPNQILVNILSHVREVFDWE